MHSRRSRRNGAPWQIAAARIFFELHRSGRWRRYYSEEQFLVRMHEAIWLSERWAEIAPVPPAELVPEHSRSVADMTNRTAA